MMLHPDTWATLSPNHRQAINGLMVQIHRQLADALQLAIDETSTMVENKNQNLSAQQRTVAVTEISRISKKLETFLEMNHLQENPTESSVGSRRAIETLLTFVLVNLDGSDSSRLRGYGELTEAQAIDIDRLIKELTEEIEGLKQRLLSEGSLP